MEEDRKQIRITKLIPGGIFQPFSSNKLDLEHFHQFLKGRCYEDGRGDLIEILAQASLSSNNLSKWA